MAFPAQLDQSPCRTQVAVMTDDALLVIRHSCDTVAPMVAPRPTKPPRKARICTPNIERLPGCIIAPVCVCVCVCVCSRYPLQTKDKIKMWPPGLLNYTADMCSGLR
ncbi:hypothetical protein NHX12_007771 [Muraenolepis orangiensis]|uniref:Uncharacterized protein n=1 Tax=Muraenolepis orangiensis TaxID=630683 RepID=A0A9Q0IBK7_9TELE|nr:hypothetical protein NHX12_007771 [Muraenolepis orangiensis]